MKYVIKDREGNYFGNSGWVSRDGKYGSKIEMARRYDCPSDAGADARNEDDKIESVKE